jgi:hypothetical protein
MLSALSSSAHTGRRASARFEFRKDPEGGRSPTDGLPHSKEKRLTSLSISEETSTVRLTVPQSTVLHFMLLKFIGSHSRSLVATTFPLSR